VSRTSESESEPASRRVGRRPWQFGLRTAFLITAAIAAWTAVFVNGRESERLRPRIEALRPLARELIVDDPDQFAVVKLDEMWYDENRWDVHLPAGDYRLCIATRGIDQRGMTEPRSFAPIAAGRHRLSLDQIPEGDDQRLIISCDGARLLDAAETKGWAGTGWTGGSEFATSAQKPADRPLVLFRRRYHVPRGDNMTAPPDGPSNGLLIWIERTGPLQDVPARSASE
jgi:hypothetical protein